MDWVLKACNEVCGQKRGMKSKRDTRYWNEDVKEAISRKRDAHKTMCKNSTEKNWNTHDKSGYKSNEVDG